MKKKSSGCGHVRELKPDDGRLARCWVELRVVVQVAERSGTRRELAWGRASGWPYPNQSGGKSEFEETVGRGGKGFSGHQKLIKIKPFNRR